MPLAGGRSPRGGASCGGLSTVRAKNGLVSRARELPPATRLECLDVHRAVRQLTQCAPFPIIAVTRGERNWCHAPSAAILRRAATADRTRHQVRVLNTAKWHPLIPNRECSWKKRGRLPATGAAFCWRS